jgi:hypothetical protein
MIPLGFDPATFRFVAQCLNYRATACPSKQEDVTKNRNLAVVLHVLQMHPIVLWKYVHLQRQSDSRSEVIIFRCL